MDILGKERDRLQQQLDEAHSLLKEAHDMIRESHMKFMATLEAATSHPRPPTSPGPSLFAQNRTRKRVEEE